METVDLADGLDLDTIDGLETFVRRNRSFQMQCLPGSYNWTAAMSNLILAQAKLTRLKAVDAVAMERAL